MITWRSSWGIRQPKSAACCISIQKSTYLWILRQNNRSKWNLQYMYMGRWPSVMPRWLNIGQVFYKHAKREEAKQYPAILTEQAWSIKDLLNGFRENLSSGRERLVPSGQDGAILSARVVNHSAGFCSSCPLTELGTSYIKDVKYCLNIACYDHPVSVVSIANGLSVRTTLYRL